MLDNRTPVGGLEGIGFGIYPDTGLDLVMVVSMAGHGLFDATTGEKIARDRDPETRSPDGAPDLTCPGLGPLEGTRVQIAGLLGGGLHSTSGNGWTLEVVAPEWPNERVLLSTVGGLHRGEPGQNWWHIFDSTFSTLRTAGFSPQAARWPSPRAAI